MAANNVSFQVTPGQMYLGSKVFGTPVVAAKPVIAAQGLAVGGNVPAVTILAGAGTVGSISQQNGYDYAGNFTLNAGTASILGGSLCSVTFGTPLDVAPSAVLCNAGYAAGTVAVGVGAVSLSKTGFTIQGPVLASGAAITVNYWVVRSPL